MPTQIHVMVMEREALQRRFYALVGLPDDEGCMRWLGSLDSQGYGGFMADGRRLLPHRVAFALANGGIPAGMEIDHSCHVVNCCAPSHLRAATRQQNATNRTGPQSNNSSGVRGVNWHKRDLRWRAYAVLNRRHHHLGFFDDVASAEAAVVAFRRQHMPFSVMDQGQSS